VLVSDRVVATAAVKCPDLVHLDLTLCSAVSFPSVHQLTSKYASAFDVDLGNVTTNMLVFNQLQVSPVPEPDDVSEDCRRPSCLLAKVMP